MVTKSKSSGSSYANSDVPDQQSIKHILSKYEYDLYKEEDDIPQKVIRVKRFSMPNKGEKWKVFEDTKVIFILDGTKLNNKEKDYLRTVEGVNFLITQFKDGIKSLNFIRKEIKSNLK